MENDMNQEEFRQEVTAAVAAKTAIDAFAKIQTDGVRFCPRCGCQTVKDQLSANALSRCAHVYICDACGTDEALRELKGDALPLRSWAVTKTDLSNGETK